MSEFASSARETPSTVREGVRHRRRRKAPDKAARELRIRLIRLAVVPAAGMLLLMVAAVLVVSAAAFREKSAASVLMGAVAAGVLVLVLACRQALAAARGVEGDNRLVAEWLEYLNKLVTAGEQEARNAGIRLRRGQRPVVSPPVPPPARSAHPFAQLARALSVYRGVVGDAMAQAESQRVQVFVNFSDRLKSLGRSALHKLDEIERDVEDPEHLAALFGVDHDMTRMQRAAESMAVMGGVTSSRSEDPASVKAVLRLGIQEIHNYARAKVVTACVADLPGYAVASVTHLLAELLENATAFSSPATQVEMRASLIPHGLLVEIDDKGVSMEPETFATLNALLADPEHSDTGARLIAEGRNGLFVVASLARRYAITVKLRPSIYGGTQAAVVVPRALLEAGRLEMAEQQAARMPAPSNPGSRPQAAPPARLGAPTPVARPAEAAQAAAAPVSVGPQRTPVGRSGGHAPAAVPPAVPKTAALHLVDSGAPSGPGPLPALPVRPDAPQAPQADERRPPPAQPAAATRPGVPRAEQDWQLGAKFASGWQSAADDEDAGPERPAPAG
ncbi:anti-sigma regulatory factor (Ser/Thr protein kinase) [Streptomyces aurantiacus]|uniref:ATP-binding protein n=1 Tax=Streptomyces aurantiacus TaxID=47760 RepID=UPI00278EA452|nr:ATP-binding protein [Streptomyces aurantiacus]MDQ0773009.1 anti-sigma regulatory factor (Ser/Thr protein kinase) [Streptomyces aurantiacus]